MEVDTKNFPSFFFCCRFLGHIKQFFDLIKFVETSVSFSSSSSFPPPPPLSSPVLHHLYRHHLPLLFSLRSCRLPVVDAVFFGTSLFILFVGDKNGVEKNLILIQIICTFAKKRTPPLQSKLLKKKAVFF